MFFLCWGFLIDQNKENPQLQLQVCWSPDQLYLLNCNWTQEQTEPTLAGI